jgi:hypothetical protein
VAAAQAVVFAGRERHASAVGAPDRCRLPWSRRLLKTVVSITSHRSTVTVACQDHYKALYDRCATVLEQSFDGARAEAMALSHSFIVDLDQWLVELSGRLESVVIQAAVLEYQLAMLAPCRGHYRTAFGSRRLALAWALAAIRGPQTSENCASGSGELGTMYGAFLSTRRMAYSHASSSC